MMKKITAELDNLVVNINEEELQKIYSCFKSQYKILKINKK
jgi:hypothetical protein